MFIVFYKTSPTNPTDPLSHLSIQCFHVCYFQGVVTPFIHLHHFSIRQHSWYSGTIVMLVHSETHCAILCSMQKECYAFSTGIDEINNRLPCQLVDGKIIAAEIVEDPLFDLYLTGKYCFYKLNKMCKICFRSYPTAVMGHILT